MGEHRFTRRSLIGAAGAAAAWWAFPARGGAAPRVVVVGAGLAGLSAAYELERRGLAVQVLEARERVGGRVHTVRFDGGQHAEAGGEFVDTGHAHLRAYLKRFGIGLDDIRKGPGGGSVAYLNGRRRRYGDLYTPDVERQLRRWQSRVNELSREVDPLEPWRAPASLDRRSVADLMDEVELSGTARTLVGLEEIRDDYTVTPARLSLLFHLHFNRLLWNQSNAGSEAFRVRGGSDRLPRALAERVPVELGAPVTEVAQRRATVTVVAGGRSYDADFCVLALPLPALRAVDFEAPQGLAAAIRGVQYGRGTKTLLRYRRRFWREQGVNGDTFSDLPFGTAWEGTDLQDGPGGVLIGFTVGRAPLAADDVAAQLERVYPGSRSLLAETARFTWEREPYSGGTYTAFAPGQLTRHWQTLRRPHGRVHLAGEHTSLYSGYMEGAIRSGKRVAAAIARAAKR